MFGLIRRESEPLASQGLRGGGRVLPNTRAQGGGQWLIGYVHFALVFSSAFSKDMEREEERKGKKRKTREEGEMRLCFLFFVFCFLTHH